MERPPRRCTAICSRASERAADKPAYKHMHALVMRAIAYGDDAASALRPAEPSATVALGVGMLWRALRTAVEATDSANSALPKSARTSEIVRED